MRARRRTGWRPGWVILLVAPVCGEGLPGSTPPLDLLLPWTLALMVGLYGCGALICRDLVHRRGRGLTGLWLVGAAYGVYEEGLVDRYWTYPTFWHDSGVGTYSVVGHTNVLLAVFLTVFHATVSITASVLVVERLFPQDRDTAWTSGRGLVVAAAVLLVVVPFVYGEFDRGPGPAGIAATIALCLGLLALGLITAPPDPGTAAATAPPPRVRAPTATSFVVVTALWVVVYGVGSTPLPWPAGVALAVLPVAVAGWRLRGLATVWPLGPEPLRALTGLAWFFVVLDVFLGVSGRWDMLAMALLTLVVLRVLRRRSTATADPSGVRGRAG